MQHLKRSHYSHNPHDQDQKARNHFFVGRLPNVFIRACANYSTTKTEEIILSFGGIGLRWRMLRGTGFPSDHKKPFFSLFEALASFEP
jgi:hypothetical protein